ncbi:MAG: hypothetical protein ACK6DZ_02745, partial [Acidobacteriota bacterium]
LRYLHFERPGRLKSVTHPAGLKCHLSRRSRTARLVRFFVIEPPNAAGETGTVAAGYDYLPCGEVVREPRSKDDVEQQAELVSGIRQMASGRRYGTGRERL